MEGRSVIPRTVIGELWTIARAPAPTAKVRPDPDHVVTTYVSHARGPKAAWGWNLPAPSMSASWALKSSQHHSL